MKIVRIDEYDIDSELEKEILSLLIESFPEAYWKDRIYFKQMPHFRYLVFENEALIGQVGLDYRVMNLNDIAVKVLGIIDICIKTEHRGKGIGSKLLASIEGFAIERKIDFLLLFADEQAAYAKNGFVSAKNICKWTKINEHNTLGIGEEEIKELMIKRIGNKAWEDGYLDMLGYLY